MLFMRCCTSPYDAVLLAWPQAGAAAVIALGLPPSEPAGPCLPKIQRRRAATDYATRPRRTIAAGDHTAGKPPAGGPVLPRPPCPRPALARPGAQSGGRPLPRQTAPHSPCARPHAATSAPRWGQETEPRPVGLPTAGDGIGARKPRVAKRSTARRSWPNSPLPSAQSQTANGTTGYYENKTFRIGTVHWKDKVVDLAQNPPYYL